MMCKRPYFDRANNDYVCSKYGMLTKVCCQTCCAPEYEPDPGKW